jgi:hypothetical protein
LCYLLRKISYQQGSDSKRQPKGEYDACTLSLSFLSNYHSSDEQAIAIECDPAEILIQNKSAKITNESVKLSVFNSINKDNFEESKKNLSTGGSVLVDGLPISGYGNYSDFQQALSREQQNFSFNLDEQQSSIAVQQTLSDNALNAYVLCLQNQNDTGVIIWMGNTSAFGDTAVVNIKWLGGVGGKTGDLEGPVQSAGLEINPGSLSALPEHWKDKETASLIVTRDRNKDGIIIIKIDGYSKNISLKKDPPTPIITEEFVSINPINLKTDKDLLTDDECVTAQIGEYFVLDPKPVPTQQILVTVERNKATVNVLTGKKVCVHAQSSTGAVGTVESQTTGHLENYGCYCLRAELYFAAL